MKILLSALFLCPLISNAQTIQDYKHALTKFQRFYNAGQGDSINAMFGQPTGIFMNGRPMWNDVDIKSTINDYGLLQSFRFLGVDTTDPDRVYVFETKFSKKGKITTSLTLDENHKLGDFRFRTIIDDPKSLKK